jgi:hypothetical protein
MKATLFALRLNELLGAAIISATYFVYNMPPHANR